MNYADKNEYEKNNSITSVGKISEKTKKYYKKLKEKKDKYTPKDIHKLYMMLSDDLRIPAYIQGVTLYNRPPKQKGRGSLMGFIVQPSNIVKIYILNPKRGTKKTFTSISKTVLHEFIHFYDIEKLNFKKSPHTSGFFKRLMDLQNQLEGRVYVKTNV